MERNLCYIYYLIKKKSNDYDLSTYLSNNIQKLPLIYQQIIKLKKLKYINSKRILKMCLILSQIHNDYILPLLSNDNDNDKNQPYSPENINGLIIMFLSKSFIYMIDESLIFTMNDINDLIHMIIATYSYSNDWQKVDCIRCLSYLLTRISNTKILADYVLSFLLNILDQSISRHLYQSPSLYISLSQMILLCFQNIYSISKELSIVAMMEIDIDIDYQIFTSIIQLLQLLSNKKSLIPKSSLSLDIKILKLYSQIYQLLIIILKHYPQRININKPLDKILLHNFDLLLSLSDNKFIQLKTNQKSLSPSPSITQQQDEYFILKNEVKEVILFTLHIFIDKYPSYKLHSYKSWYSYINNLEILSLLNNLSINNIHMISLILIQDIIKYNKQDLKDQIIFINKLSDILVIYINRFITLSSNNIIAIDIKYMLCILNTWYISIQRNRLDIKLYNKIWSILYQLLVKEEYFAQYEINKNVYKILNLLLDQFISQTQTNDAGFLRERKNKTKEEETKKKKKML